MPTRGRADRHTAPDLYANGPVMTHLDQHRYGGFLVLKKDNNEPVKEALALWQVEFGYVLQFASAIRLQARFVQSLIVNKRKLELRTPVSLNIGAPASPAQVNTAMPVEVSCVPGMHFHCNPSQASAGHR